MLQKPASQLHIIIQWNSFEAPLHLTSQAAPPVAVVRLKGEGLPAVASLEASNVEPQYRTEAEICRLCIDKGTRRLREAGSHVGLSPCWFVRA